MSVNQCAVIMPEVIDIASERFGSTWVLNQEDYRILLRYCKAIDDLIPEFEGVGFDLSVDEDTMNVSIVLTCKDIVIYSQDHVFYDLISRALQVQFSSHSDETVDVKFVFPSVWDHDVRVLKEE